MYLAPEDQVIQVDRGQGTITRRPPRVAQDRPFRYSTPGDRTCVSGIRRWGADFWMLGMGSVAGVPVIRWMRSNPEGGYTEVYLAPSLDCRPLKTYTVYKRFGLLPTFINSTEAVSVELGEPKAELFALPTGLREILEPPAAPR